MPKFIKVLLLLIISLSFILRLYKLGSIPAGLEWDEVAIGYDAYSILKTGRDQFGNFMPLTFRSLDDYKPPLYEYLTVPSVAIFGLNEFSTRLPSAIFGSLTILVTFFLVKELFKENFKSDKPKNKTEIIALLASFLLAISPWHLQFSRAAFEVNLSIFIITSAVLFFLKGLINYKYLIVSAIFFGLALYSYHSTRVIAPLLLLILIILNYQSLKSKFEFRQLLIPISIYLVFFVFFLPILFSKDAQIRFNVTNISNIFHDFEMENNLKVAVEADKNSQSSLLFRLYHGKKPILFKTLISNYLVHYSPQFLFLKADVTLHHAPDFALIYITELPFILTGIYLFIKKYISRKNGILLAWFLIAPLPAAITLQVPHAVRTEIFLPTFQVFSALGIFSIFTLLRQKAPPSFGGNEWHKESYPSEALAKKDFGYGRVTTNKRSRGLKVPGVVTYLKTKKLFYRLFIIILLFALYFDFNKYLHQYYVHTPYEISKDWMFGRKEAALFTESIKNKYDKVIVSVKLQHPHIFFLFYLKYDPKQYLSQGGTYSGGWGDDHNKFDKYEFKYITYEELKEKYPNSIIVGFADEFPRGIDTLKTIYYPDGKEAIKIIAI